MPFVDTLFRSNFVLPRPQDPAGAPEGGVLDMLKPGMYPAEIALFLLWMVKKEIIHPLTFPFLMLLLPIFTDGQGHLSFTRNMRGALPVFQRGMGESEPAPSAEPAGSEAPAPPK